MKIPTFLIILASSLLFSIYANAQEPIPVLDNEGRPLNFGAKYHMVLVQPGGGSLSLAYNPDTTCPLNVIQSPLYPIRSPVDNDFPPIPSALPVTFYPSNPSPVILTDTPLNFEFEFSSPCNERNVWKLESGEGTTETNFITTGGVVGRPGCESMYNWFKILNVDDSPYYKLVYNPQVCFPYRNVDITVVEQGGQARLAAKIDGPQDPPMLITFSRFNGAMDSH